MPKTLNSKLYSKAQNPWTANDHQPTNICLLYRLFWIISEVQGVYLILVKMQGGVGVMHCWTWTAEHVGSVDTLSEWRGPEEGSADFFVVMVKASPGTHNRSGGRR
jgi:hypothetical protein